MIQPAVILAAVLASLIAAVSMAAPQKPVKPGEKPAKEQAQLEAKKIKATKKAGRPDREFPVMFDVADRARKHKAKKGKGDK